MTAYTFHAAGEDDTTRLGAALGETLPCGTVIALDGPLGAGKTRLVQGMAVALGVPREAVTSPTFVLLHEYRQGRLPIFHFDAYRIRDDDEFRELGAEEYFAAGGITVIEWAERVRDCLPDDCLSITIEVTSEAGRAVRIQAEDAHSISLITEVARRMGGPIEAADSHHSI